MPGAGGNGTGDVLLGGPAGGAGTGRGPGPSGLAGGGEGGVERRQPVIGSGESGAAGRGGRYAKGSKFGGGGSDSGDALGGAGGGGGEVSVNMGGMQGDAGASAGGGSPGSAAPQGVTAAGGPPMPGLMQSGSQGGPSGAGQSVAGGGSAASASVAIAQARGKNWASLATQDRPIPLTRPIQIECAIDEFRVLDDGGKRVRSRIPLDGETAAAVDPLVKAIHARVAEWGLAGDRMYWKPELVLSATADGRSRREDLERLLADSGLDTRHSGHHDEIRHLPPVQRTSYLREER